MVEPTPCGRGDLTPATSRVGILDRRRARARVGRISTARRSARSLLQSRRSGSVAPAPAHVLGRVEAEAAAASAGAVEASFVIAAAVLAADIRGNSERTACDVASSGSSVLTW